MIDNLARLFAPFLCLGCGREEDRLICEACVAEIPKVPSRCYLCKATTRSYDVCRACKPRTPLRKVAAWTRHEGLPKELIHAAKYERARAGLHEIAGMMVTLLPFFGKDIVLAHVPTASSRVRERGYDQAKVIARELSRASRLPHVNLLMRIGQAHQVGSSRSERRAHIEGAFRPVHVETIKGAHIVLVDDVCTTGASLEAAARVLKQAGAKRVDALVFSQPN